MRLASWLLTKCIAAERRDAIIGDLDEEYARGRSARWYWRETIIAIAHEPMPVAPLLAVVLGVVTGAAQLAILGLMIRRPVFLMATYALLVFACAVYVKRRAMPWFGGRFAFVLSPFVISTAIVYLLLHAVDPRSARLSDIPLTGHLWRIGLLLAIGIAAAASVAYLTNGSRHRMLSIAALGTGALFALGWGWPAIIATSAAILVAAAIYIHLDDVRGFVPRFQSAALPFALAFVSWIEIHNLNHRLPVVVLLPLANVLAGCVIAAVLIARFTPARRREEAPTS